MSKNPFVNCKSRKRRKVRIPTEPKEKLFCPHTMVRYDNTTSIYSTIWVCKMCLASLLSTESVKQHVLTCNTKSNKTKLKKTTKKSEETQYICKTCNKVFSRGVTLKKHLEEHEKSSNNDSERSENEVDPEDAKDNNYAPEEESSS